MRAFALLPLLVLLAGCSNAVDTSELEAKLETTNWRIEKLEEVAATLERVESRLRVAEAQATANQETLAKQAALQSKLTDSIVLHAGSLQRSSEIDSGLKDLIKQNGELTAQLKSKVDGNRLLITDLIDTVKDILSPSR